MQKLNERKNEFKLISLLSVGGLWLVLVWYKLVGLKDNYQYYFIFCQHYILDGSLIRSFGIYSLRPRIRVPDHFYHK